MARRDRDAAAACLAPGLVVDWRHCGERIAGAARFVVVNRDYPGDRCIGPRRVLVLSAGRAAAERRVNLAPDRWDVASFAQAEGGRIVRLAELWTHHGRPPASRTGARRLTERLLIRGAPSVLGRGLVAQMLARGYRVTAPARAAALAGPRPAVAVPAFDPGEDSRAFRRHLLARDAVIDGLGLRRRGEVRFFSEMTRALLAAMEAAGPRRPIAIAGVGASETAGHGGFLDDRLIDPLLTRAFDVDKHRQAGPIRDSDADRSILRSAPFTASPGAEPFDRLTVLRPGMQPSHATPAEGARLVPDCTEQGLQRGEAVLFGHGAAG